MQAWKNFYRTCRSAWPIKQVHNITVENIPYFIYLHNTIYSLCCWDNPSTSHGDHLLCSKYQSHHMLRNSTDSAQMLRSRRVQGSMPGILCQLPELHTCHNSITYNVCTQLATQLWQAMQITDKYRKFLTYVWIYFFITLSANNLHSKWKILYSKLTIHLCNNCFIWMQQSCGNLMWKTAFKWILLKVFDQILHV